MKAAGSIKLGLDRKLKAVHETPAGFPFFVSIHDFVRYIESTPSFAVFFAGAQKRSRASELSPKYSVMRQIYQGVEDIDLCTTDDLGHDRYVAIRELGLIRKAEFSENNSLWRRRELMRKMADEIYKTLCDHLSESATGR
jgi:hypothetical protein